MAKQTIKQCMNWAIVAMVAGMFFSLLVSNLTNRGRFLEGQVWPSLALISLGFTIIGLGVIAVTVAWWGALFNTRRLDDSTWFKLLLWSGVLATVTAPLLGIGALVAFGVLIAYVYTGPDGVAVPEPELERPSAPPQKLAPTN